MPNQELSTRNPISLKRQPLPASKNQGKNQSIQVLHQQIDNLESRLEKETLTKDLIIQELRRKVVDLEKQLQRREFEALTDELTQLANRRAFNFGLAREWKRCRREKHPFSLIRIELDYLQRYYNAHGQLAADKLLQDVAAAILFCVDRPGDLAARLGREKFGVILPNTPLAGTQTIGRQILEFVRQVSYQPTDHRTHASVSLGCAGMATSQTINEKSPRALLTAADQALYLAKAQGRNQMIVCRGS